MIHSSSVEGHHFLIARRRGYDMAEVDAVIKRLVATLRKYEEREAAEETAKVADLDEVRRSRERIEDTSLATEELHQQAAAKLSEANQLAAETLTVAREEADHHIESARAEAASLIARRHERSEALITSALSEVKALRARTLRETNDFSNGKRAEAASILQTAQLTADELIENARHEAGSILGRARREHAALEQRLAQLRSAIAGIEGQFRHLAESTLEQTEIMASMISLETDDLEEVLETTKEPEVVRLTQQSVSIDLTDEETGPTEPSDADDRFAINTGDTIYQRRGGGVRRRLEEDAAEGARESGEESPV